MGEIPLCALVQSGLKPELISSGKAVYFPIEDRGDAMKRIYEATDNVRNLCDSCSLYREEECFPHADNSQGEIGIVAALPDNSAYTVEEIFGLEM